MVATALEIEAGWELERFCPGTIQINGKGYLVLTGYEGTGRCFWCGGELRGKLKHYCYGHMKEYYRHFEWQSARNWCCERQEGLCANCGTHHGYSLEVHHIVPLKGEARYFSAFNLPWNLIGFCHECHQEIHRIMRPPKIIPELQDSWREAMKVGQGIMPFEETEALKSAILAPYPVKLSPSIHSA